PCPTHATLHLTSFFLLRIPRRPSSTLFPYTTLSRSHRRGSGRPFANPFYTTKTPAGPGSGGGSRVASGRRPRGDPVRRPESPPGDRKSTRLNSSHLGISYAVFCLKKKIQAHQVVTPS